MNIILIIVGVAAIISAIFLMSLKKDSAGLMFNVDLNEKEEK